jgi:hypothetical protein
MTIDKHIEIISITESEDSDYYYIDINVEAKDFKRFIVYFSLIKEDMIPEIILNSTSSKVKVHLSVLDEIKATKGYYSYDKNIYLLKMTKNELDNVIKFFLLAAVGQIEQIDFEFLPLTGEKKLYLSISLSY